MIIRSATAADIPAMLTLERQSDTAAHWSQEQYEKAVQFEGRIVLVVEDDAAVAGFLVGRRLDGEWEVENVAVAGTGRRHGLGTRLVGEFLNRARSASAQSIYLEVRESNRAARRLYEKCSFVESGRRKRYYRAPEEDAVLYRLDFS